MSNSGKWKSPYFLFMRCNACKHISFMIQEKSIFSGRIEFFQVKTQLQDFSHFLSIFMVPILTPFKEKEKVNVNNHLILPVANRDVCKLITTSNLIECGFLKERVRSTHPKKVKRKVKKCIEQPGLLSRVTSQAHIVSSY